jgi:ribosomal protein S18 acetylase RimI-like enzyme
MRMKEALKKIAGAVCGKYQLVRIYRKDLEESVIDSPGTLRFMDIDERKALSEFGSEDVKSHAWYGGPNAFGYGVMQGQHFVCACWYWTKGHKGLPAQFFPQLQDDEAVMVDLVTAGNMRGRGYASALIGYSEERLKAAGFSRLWTWVWHSNWPSIRTFEKSGWTYTGFLVEVQPFGSGRRFQIRLGPR